VRREGRLERSDSKSYISASHITNNTFRARVARARYQPAQNCMTWATMLSFPAAVIVRLSLQNPTQIKTAVAPPFVFIIFSSYGELDVAVLVRHKGEGERRLERSDSKIITPSSYITNNLPLVALLLTSPLVPTLFAIRFAHRRLGWVGNFQCFTGTVTSTT